MFLKFRGTNDKGWLWLRIWNCGAVGVVFGMSCESSYVFRVVDILVLFLFERLKVFDLLMERIFQKILQKVCVLRLLVCLLVCVLRMYCRFLLRERKEIQEN